MQNNISEVKHKTSSHFLSFFMSALYDVTKSKDVFLSQECVCTLFIIATDTRKQQVFVNASSTAVLHEKKKSNLTKQREREHPATFNDKPALKYVLIYTILTTTLNDIL